MQKNAVRVLVVDDDIDLLMLMERKLQQYGYVVESAVSLAEAEYVDSIFKPHLVLIDINVGGEDGRQLCWKIKHTAESRKTKVILMSGMYYPTSRVMLFGADDFVAKPYPPEFVQQKIAAVLAQQEPVSQLVPVHTA
jgi:DNA-binding response OmpR family regulator